MKTFLFVLTLCSGLASICCAAIARLHLLKDDFGTEQLEHCYLQYYYYIPCPTYSWFWEFYGWQRGEVIGTCFTIGDLSTGGWARCDSSLCYEITQVRVLDFAGYGAIYPGFYTFEFDIYCADENGCPVGPSIWNSGPLETTEHGWNFFPIDSVIVSSCFANQEGASRPRLLLTATHTGSDCTYPGWGLDNISTPVSSGCQMHDAGCLPAIYPRPLNSHYPIVHSGYYGINFAYCPPTHFEDPKDSSDGGQYGYLELAWRLRINCTSSTTKQATWSCIKSLYW